VTVLRNRQSITLQGVDGVGQLPPLVEVTVTQPEEEPVVVVVMGRVLFAVVREGRIRRDSNATSVWNCMVLNPLV
jgi:hypothetical protein